ncbi:MAG: tetratricopeptide repeat protein [Gemmatimonadaceae bacterium]
MSSDPLVDLQRRYAAIAERLDAASTPGGRESTKADIIALYKDVESQLAQLAAMRDDIRRLVERWKATQRPTVASPPAPQFVAEPALPVADHLNASTFREKGWNLISLGDHEGAVRALGRALELAPGDLQTESLLGWALMLQEKYDDALLNFQKVLVKQPTNSLARINLGFICLKKRIFGEAIEHLSKAIRMDNDRKATLYAHFYLGLVYLEREMYDDAENFFRKTIALGPNLIEAYFELGRTLWFDGKRAEAVQTWRDGESANKFNPWGKRCAEMVTHIEQGGAPSRAVHTAL